MLRRASSAIVSSAMASSAMASSACTFEGCIFRADVGGDGELKHELRRSAGGSGGREDPGGGPQPLLARLNPFGLSAWSGGMDDGIGGGI